MKPFIRNILIILSIILFWKLFFIPPKNVSYPSNSINKSKRVGAYVGKCRIFKIDTLIHGYQFPIEKIWVEKKYSLGRNSLGIVIHVKDEDKRIVFDIDPNNSFFTKSNFTDEWVVKDSLSQRVGSSNKIINLNCHYQNGDTAIFKIFEKNKYDSNLWKDDTMKTIFKIYTVCEYEKNRQ